MLHGPEKPVAPCDYLSTAEHGEGETSMLTREQIDFYNTNGFLALEGVYGPQEMKEARAVVEEFVERAYETLRKIIPEAEARSGPYQGRICTTYQYLGDMPRVTLPFEVTRTRNNEPDHVLAGDQVCLWQKVSWWANHSQPDGQPVGACEVFVDGAAAWFYFPRLPYYYTNIDGPADFYLNLRNR
jgi:hypothetical protein